MATAPLLMLCSHLQAEYRAWPSAEEGFSITVRLKDLIRSHEGDSLSTIQGSPQWFHFFSGGRARVPRPVDKHGTSEKDPGQERPGGRLRGRSESSGWGESAGAERSLA